MTSRDKPARSGPCKFAVRIEPLIATPSEVPIQQLVKLSFEATPACANGVARHRRLGDRRVDHARPEADARCNDAVSGADHDVLDLNSRPPAAIPAPRCSRSAAARPSGPGHPARSTAPDRHRRCHRRRVQASGQSNMPHVSSTRWPGQKPPSSESAGSPIESPRRTARCRRTLGRALARSGAPRRPRRPRGTPPHHPPEQRQDVR